MHSLQTKKSTPRTSGNLVKPSTFTKEPLLTPSSNILLDVSQDHNKNAFSGKMEAVYKACQNDSGKRSIDRIEAFLADQGKDSAFTAVARHVTAKFLSIDKRHVTKRVQRVIEQLLNQLLMSVDGVLDNKVVDEEEAAARDELKEILPVLHFEWEEANQILQTVKKEYEKSK
jgi:hypothetical protein